MRIVTWNINGLRACLRRRFDGKLVNLLNFLEADIICLQETKLSRQEAQEDLALADGWESFFAYCRTRGGYSGVATFCRADVAMPLAALDGFSGILPQTHSKAKDSPPLSDAQEVLSRPCAGLYDRVSQDELERLDSEGRVVITDHGSFVLLNVYGPAISTEESAEERYAFKLRFYEGLLFRIQALRGSGRSVVLLGDLNISLAPIDSCDPGPLEDFRSRTDRRMLTQLLTTNGGPFLDVFRRFHPTRREAYTCWSTASGARINNYGTRIDLILAAGPVSDIHPAAFHELFVASDIQMDVHGSDHAPAWADLAPHAHVAIGDVPPPLSTRYQFTGKQRNLRSWLSGSQLAVASEGPVNPSQQQSTQQPALLAPHEAPAVTSSSGRGGSGSNRANGVLGKRAPSRGSAQQPSGKTKAAKLRAGPGQSSLRAFMKPPPQTQPSSASAQVQPEQPQQRGFEQAGTSDGSDLRSVHVPGDSVRLSQAEPASCQSQGMQVAAVPERSAGKAVEGATGRSGLHPSTSALPDVAPGCGGGLGSAVAAGGEPSTSAASATPSSLSWTELAARGIGDAADALAEAASNWDSGAGSEQENWVAEQNVAAKAVWKEIQERMKPPMCKGHGEPCVIRQVKKGGPNQGRVFYVCRRAAGNLPEGRCDHFAWAAAREMRGSKMQKSAASMTLKQSWN